MEGDRYHRHRCCHHLCHRHRHHHRHHHRSGSSLTALTLQVFLSEERAQLGAAASARQSMSITSYQVFLGQPWPWPPVGLSFWTFLNQPSPRSTWPCHLSLQVQSNFWSLVVTPHIQWIIARSLHCRRCKSDEVGAQVLLAWSMALLTHEL